MRLYINRRVDEPWKTIDGKPAEMMACVASVCDAELVIKTVETWENYDEDAAMRWFDDMKTLQPWIRRS